MTSPMRKIYMSDSISRNVLFGLCKTVNNGINHLIHVHRCKGMSMFRLVLRYMVVFMGRECHFLGGGGGGMKMRCLNMKQHRSFSYLQVAWLVVLGFNAPLTAMVISWRSVTHMCFLAFSHQY